MKKQKVILFDIDYTLFNTDIFKKTQLKKHSVYDEIYDVLAQLSKIARLGIFSEGNLDLQKTKLLKTNIHNYFSKEHIHIVEEKDKDLRKILKKYKDKMLFLVDDKLPTLHMAKTINPHIFTIWIKRGRYAEKQKEIPGFKPDAEVKNLSEITKFIIHNS